MTVRHNFHNFLRWRHRQVFLTGFCFSRQVYLLVQVYVNNITGSGVTIWRRCDQNRMVPGSNTTRRSAWLRDPTSLQSSQWPSGRVCKRKWLTSGKWSTSAAFLIMAPSWPWGSQIAVKKMTISFYKRLNRNREIRNTPIWVLSDIWRLTRVRDTKFGMSLVKCYWMPQNARVTTFTVLELLRENQQMG